MRRALGIPILALVVGGLVVPPAQADIICSLFGRCSYESPAFGFTVVDAESGQPLPDVHALAEWVQEGLHGLGGPFMVQDAVSGPDGLVSFPAWGPIPGPASGLHLGMDPVITLFKPGFKTFVLYNRRFAEGQLEVTRRRWFGEDGKVVRLDPFRATSEAWVEELRKAVSGSSGGRSEKQQLQFRGPYLTRLRRIWAERGNVPRRYQEPGEFFWHRERTIKFLEGGG